MKLLITGTGGYIGSITSRALLRCGYEVVGVDACYRGYIEPQKKLQEEFGSGKFRYYRADIKNEICDILAREPGIDAVLHFAAYCNVGESEANPNLYFDNNVGSVGALMEALRLHGIKKIVFSSTCATYGDPQYVPIDEDHPLGTCSSPYGESKQMAERIISWYSKLFNIDYVVLRYFNICGASDDGEFGDAKQPSFHLMQNAVRSAMGLGKFVLNFTEVDTPDGSPIRDYINVEDLATGHVKALSFLMKGPSQEVFNLGTGTGNSVYEIVNKVEEIMGVTFEKSVGTRRKGDAVAAVADNRKAKDLLDWEPTRDLEKSVRTLREWYSKYPNGWKE